MNTEFNSLNMPKSDVESKGVLKEKKATKLPLGSKVDELKTKLSKNTTENSTSLDKSLKVSKELPEFTDSSSNIDDLFLLKKSKVFEETGSSSMGISQKELGKIPQFKNSKQVESYIESHIKQLKNTEGEVEKVKIIGKIAAVLIKEVGSFGLEKLKDKINLEQAVLEKIEPYIEQLKVIVPFIQLGKIDKGIKECKKEINLLQEELKKRSPRPNAGKQLLEVKIELNKLEQLRMNSVVGAEGLNSNQEKAIKFAVEKLVPILPEGAGVFKNVDFVSKEVGSIINTVASSLKVKQKYESIQLLSNLKDVLKEKLSELKKGEKNQEIFREIKAKEKEIKELEEQIFSEGAELTKETLFGMTNIFIGMEKLLPVGIQGFDYLIGSFSFLSTLPELGGKGREVVNRIQNIHKLRQEANSLDKTILKLTQDIEQLAEQLPNLSKEAKNLVFQQIKAKEILLTFVKLQQNAIRKSSIGNEILELTDDLVKMLSTGGDVAKSALVLLGASKVVLASLGTAALGLVGAGIGLKATKFLLHDSAIVPKTVEDVKIWLSTYQLDKEFNGYKQSMELLSKDTFSFEFSKGQRVLKKSDIVNSLKGKIDEPRKQLVKVYKSLDEVCKKLETTIDHSLVNQLQSILKETVRLESLLTAITDSLSYVDRIKGDVVLENYKDIMKFKMELMNNLNAEPLSDFIDKYGGLEKRKTSNVEKYTETKKLDRIGISKEEHENLKQSLGGSLDNEVVVQEFSRYLNLKSKEDWEVIFNGNLDSKQQAGALLDYLFNS